MRNSRFTPRVVPLANNSAGEKPTNPAKEFKYPVGTEVYFRGQYPKIRWKILRHLENGKVWLNKLCEADEADLIEADVMLDDED